MDNLVIEKKKLLSIKAKEEIRISKSRYKYDPTETSKSKLVKVPSVKVRRE